MKFDSEAERLAEEVTAHKADVVGWSGDADAAAKVRETEKKDYYVLHTDLTESVHAIAEAMRMLKAQNFDRAGDSSALLQKTAMVLSALAPEASRKITAFLAQASDSQEDVRFVQAPEVPTTAYEFQSGGIIKMLEDLQTKFKDELTEADKEEVKRKHASNTLQQDMASSISAAEGQIASKTKAELKNREDSNEASKTLKNIVDTRADDAAYLASLTSTCEKKAADFESRQKLRDEEVTALEKAVEILSSSAVAGHADKHLPKAAALVHVAVRKGASLAQLRASHEQKSPFQLEAADFLREASARLGSRVLSTLAVRARDDPFAKVKVLVEELVKRLIAEATSEASHKGWCDKELSTNEQTRKSRGEEIDMLTGETEKLSADISMMKKNIVELNAGVAQLEADVANATDLRNVEKAENEQTIQDAKDGQTAMAEVIKVLQDFYGEAAKATVLVQGKKQPTDKTYGDAPEVFGDTPYTGMQAESGGVLGMMEVINSDFARLESDTTASETASAEEYDKFMEASAIDKAQKEKDIEFYTTEQQDKEIVLGDKEAALETAKTALQNAENEFKQLKPACLETGMSYEERKQRREDELDALKEALRILSGDTEVIR